MRPRGGTLDPLRSDMMRFLPAQDQAARPKRLLGSLAGTPRTHCKGCGAPGIPHATVAGPAAAGGRDTGVGEEGGHAPCRCRRRRAALRWSPFWRRRHLVAFHCSFLAQGLACSVRSPSWKQRQPAVPAERRHKPCVSHKHIRVASEGCEGGSVLRAPRPGVPLSVCLGWGLVEMS